MKNNTTTTNDSGRDGRGRFTTGNSHGKGNPLAGRIAKLRAALIQAVDENDIVDLTTSLLDRAQQGDIAAAKLLLGYLLGQPSRMIGDDETADDGPILIRRRVSSVDTDGRVAVAEW